MRLPPVEARSCRGPLPWPLGTAVSNVCRKLAAGSAARWCWVPIVRSPSCRTCSEGRSGGAGQHRCYVVYEGSFHRSLIARPRVVFESLVLEQSMLYDSTMI